MTRVRVRAPGKLNAYLSVGPLRPDGYHDLATVFVALDLYETVTASPDQGIQLSFSGPIDTRGLSVGEDNLAVRAVRLIAAEAGIDVEHHGVRLEIEKHVPIAGGMAGGSADAAATLLACDALWGLDLPQQRLLELAAQLGADAPFPLLGGAAIGTGRGDLLEPIPVSSPFGWVLALPAGQLSTPAVFAELDRLRAEHGADPTQVPAPGIPPAVVSALQDRDPAILAASLHNDLQPAAVSLQPALAELLAAGERGGAGGIVSGSGPTCAFLVHDDEVRDAVDAALRDRGFRTVQARGPVPGAERLD